MTNRSGGLNFLMTGRPSDRNWMDTKRIRPTWMGNEARNTVDSGIEFTENRHDPLLFQRKRHADDDMLLKTYADRPTSTRNIPWDGPHKRILFESEDPESTLSGSETQEVRPGWPPDDMCADSTRYRGSFDDRDREGLRLCSNGWDETTASLQLIAHLDREALNVAFLVPEDQRRRPGVLLKTLSAHYASPGRLAKYKRQFERMTRPPGDDPAAFAIELETLARKAFVDVDATVRLQLVRDKFITGQEHRALRRHLDSVGPDTPISDIVDRCRVWESHEEKVARPTAEHEPTGPRGVFQVTHQISDENNRMSTEADKTSSEFEMLAQQLRERVQRPASENSETIDIENLLRLLLLMDTEIDKRNS